MNGLYLTIARWVVFVSVALGVYLSGDANVGLMVLYACLLFVLCMGIYKKFKNIPEPVLGIIVHLIVSACMATGIMIAVLTL